MPEKGYRVHGVSGVCRVYGVRRGEGVVEEVNGLIGAKGGKRRGGEPIEGWRENLVEIVAVKLAERLERWVAFDLPAVDGFPLGAVKRGFAGVDE